MYEYDKDGFITKYDGTEKSIVIPNHIKGIRAFSFVDLNIKEIVFEEMIEDSFIIEENSFVGLQKLEVVDCSNLKLKQVKELMKAFSDCPLDICLLMNNSIATSCLKYLTNKLINTYSFCLFSKQDVELDLSKFKSKKIGNEIILYDIDDRKFEVSSNVFFPDYYEGLKVVLDISSKDFQSYLTTKIFKEASFIKFPIIKDSKGINFFSFKHSNVRNIHLSRLQKELPKTFIREANGISRIYIPENITTFGGFCDCKELEEVIFEDSGSIDKIHPNTLLGTKIQKNSDEDKNNNIFYFGEFALSCRYSKEVKPDLKIKEGIRVISDGFFSSGTASPFWKSLTSIDLPNSLEIIGEKAFYNCAGCDITIPKNVKFIGEKAFSFEIWEDEDEPTREIVFEGMKFQYDRFEVVRMELPFK